jgi:hypothetical protein
MSLRDIMAGLGRKSKEKGVRRINIGKSVTYGTDCGTSDGVEADGTNAPVLHLIRL